MKPLHKISVTYNTRSANNSTPAVVFEANDSIGPGEATLMVFGEHKNCHSPVLFSFKRGKKESGFAIAMHEAKRLAAWIILNS
jgi:hypothetical protein